MTAGQGALALGGNRPADGNGAVVARVTPVDAKLSLRVQRASEAELAAHAARLAGLDQASANGSVWRRAEHGD